jgi:prepilin-type N-terminal cleavage/methylation domain-containing protein
MRMQNVIRAGNTMCYSVELNNSFHKVHQRWPFNHKRKTMSTQSMSKSLQRGVQSGFTLIELLIVVIILAILAAIAIPQFTNSAADAQLAALDTNLSNIRTAVETYRTQHNGLAAPGAAASSNGTECTGVAGTGAAGSELAFTQQLTSFSNAAGQTCSVASAAYRFGPYFTRGLPTEPFTNSAAVAVTTTGAAIVSTAAGTGWAFDTVSRQLVANSLVQDPNGRALNTH